MGRRVDGQAHRTMVRQPQQCVSRRGLCVVGRRVPIGGGRRGSSAPQDCPAAAIAPGPLRTGRRAASGGVDGRAIAGRGHRRRRRARGGLPVHGVRDAPRDGGIGGPGGRAATAGAVEPLAMADLHSSNWAAGVPLAPHRALAAADHRPAGGGRSAGQGVRPDVGRGDRRAVARGGRSRLGEGAQSGTSCGCGRTASAALSSTTRSVPPCWRGFRANRAESCTSRSPSRCNGTLPDRVFDLAYHFDAAGQSERALELRPAGGPAGAIPAFPGSGRAAVSHCRARRASRPIGPRSTESPKGWATC